MMTRKYFLKLLVLCCCPLWWGQCSNQEPDAAQWQEDFHFQPIQNRPRMEVRYTDGSRQAFEILAQDYALTGALKTPHLLTSQADGKPWLWFEIEDEHGTVYSSQNCQDSSRINLYRRGPYHCEVHWFDISPETESGVSSGLKGDITLFCYPEKILAEARWIATKDFPASGLKVKGLVDREFEMRSYVAGQDTVQAFSFPLFGETEPLSDEAFKLLVGTDEVTYDHRRGCYVVGSHAAGPFHTYFYEVPNDYEQVTFQVQNDQTKRKIYICHKSTKHGGIVEGGMLLDQEEHPMPLVVQVSKNFAGEIEEKYYNPQDTAFSETFFPLYLDPGESHTLTSLHLYQNWGNHMTKHWSSLGAWMDYFHSSTGVTETTCYVPFKFAGLGGVVIADFRAMSQECFWGDQPQHDNIAGHSYLSYYDGSQWVHSVYQGTTYRSTGPNWYDIGLHYLTADGKIRTTLDIYETPQSDELRHYFHVRYEVLEPLTIEQANTDFRMLNITSRIQSFLYDRFAATNVPEQLLYPEQKPFPVKGEAMPASNFFMALYGDTIKYPGSNAIIIKDFMAPEGITPAATVQLGPYKDVFSDREQDTRLCLVPGQERLELKAGDVIEFTGYFLPYGDALNTRSAESVVHYDTELAPRVISIRKGTVCPGLPVHVKAENNQAEFTVSGGKNLIPVVISGLTKWRTPRLFVQEDGQWRLVSHARNSTRDGYQTFCAEDGSFGTVFLLPSGDREQTLKFTLGKEAESDQKLSCEGDDLKIAVAGENRVLLPSFSDGGASVTWTESRGPSWWFEQTFDWGLRGCRVTPNDNNVDMEYWWLSNTDQDPHWGTPILFEIDDEQGAECKVLTEQGWQDLADGAQLSGPVYAVATCNGASNPITVFALRSCTEVSRQGNQLSLLLAKVERPQNKRRHIRGRIYQSKASYETLRNRVLSDLY